MNKLIEATRAQLLNKSKTADVVKKYGTTRLEGRNRVHRIDDIHSYNRIDMSALFKANLLSFIIKVEGETDTYSVEVLFEGIITNIAKQIQSNGKKLEYKCVYRAIVDAINNNDVFISCSCPDHYYRFSYIATKQMYNSGKPQLIPADVMNPRDSKGAGCKHVMNILANLDWALKLATTIYNYCVYMEEHMPDKYYEIMYPVLFGEKYEGDYEDNLDNTMDNDDTSVIDAANDEGGDEYEDEEEEE